ncbi:MAG: c-type cytochrome [Gemmatimonadetes bacterium]|nr:c-type cytochrome [Gemmatimonadota bacterium]
MLQKSMLVLAGLILGAAVTWMMIDRGPSYQVDAAAAERGQAFYRVCAACHGEDGAGNPDTQAPQLAGQYPWYLERQLRNFRAGIRGVDSADVNGSMMRPMAVGLQDDQAVTDVVAYIGTLR